MLYELEEPLVFRGKDEAGNTVPVNGVFYRKILNDFFLVK